MELITSVVGAGVLKAKLAGKDGIVVVKHDPEASAIWVTADGDFGSGQDMYDGSAANFLEAIGFLPDPAQAGTWYEVGAFCIVPTWVELSPGFRIERGNPEFYREMRDYFRRGNRYP